MRDALGRELNIGDYVIISGYWYGSQMCIGKISNIRKSFIDVWYAYNMSPTSTWEREVRMPDKYLVRISEDDFTDQVRILEQGIQISIARREERERNRAA